MATYTWVSGTDASTGTYSPALSTGASPGANDTVIFANDVDCNWDLTDIGIIEVRESYTGILTITTNVAIKGLTVAKEGCIDSVGARILTFSGTPSFNSGETHIHLGVNGSIFRNATARGNLTFTMGGSSAITYDSGIYPHLVLSNGNHRPEYYNSTEKTNQVKLLTLTVNSGANFAPASATPSANDRLRKWILETSAAGQFVIASGVGSFDGGYAEWTFQAHSSGFAIPTSGIATYNQCKFTFDKMVIDASIGGVGKWAQVMAPSRLILTDFTVNVGASVKGSSSSTGCAILLVNKPTIHGTWAFLPVADGYYVYPKTGETLSYVDGGTGLRSLGTANQVLAVNAGATALEFQTVSGGGGSGDVVGPSSATANNFVAFDGTTGKLVKDSAKGASDFATAAQGVTADAALPKAGGQMTGNITMSGSQTVDGRDLSVDGAKLDTIATNATNTDAPAIIDNSGTPAFATGITKGEVQTLLNVADGSTANAGTVTSVATGTGLSGGTITSSGTVSLANTSVSAGSYTNANITVDAQGRLTAAANGSSGGGTPAGSNTQVQFNDGGSFGANANIVIDDSNTRLGVGEASPDCPLHVTYSGANEGFILESTDGGSSSAPDLVLRRNSSSPADNDVIGNIQFRGMDSNSEETYFTILAQMADVTDGSIDARVKWYLKKGGSSPNHSFEFVGNTIGVRESSSVDSLQDNADYGRLWVKNDNPNNLYFTDNAGNDIAITNNGALAGGGGGGGMTSFTLAGGSGTPQTITNGNTLTIGTGANLSSVAGATDTVTINTAFAGNPTLPAPAFSQVPDDSALGLIPYGFIGPIELSDGTQVFVPAFVQL